MTARISNPLMRVLLFSIVLVMGALLAALGARLMLSQLVRGGVLTLPLQPDALTTQLLILLLSLPQFLLFFGLVWLFCRHVDRQPLASLGFEARAPGLWLLRGIALGGLLLGLVFIAVWQSGGLQVLGGSWSMLSLFLSAILFSLVAVGEELVFRGYLLGNLQQALGAVWAVVLSALLFSLVHLGNHHVASLAVLNIFLAGLLLGLLRVRAGLWLSIGMHFGWNYVQGPILGIAVSGSQVPSLLQTMPLEPAWLSGGAFGLEASLLASLALMAALFVLYPWNNKQKQNTEG